MTRDLRTILPPSRAQPTRVALAHLAYFYLLVLPIVSPLVRQLSENTIGYQATLELRATWGGASV